MDITIIAPVYNDWDCLLRLSNDIVRTKQGISNIDLIAINDFSSISRPDHFELDDTINFTQIDLSINVGHQRAILIGLCHLVEQKTSSSHVIVMDADGEDDPKYIDDLIKTSQSSGDTKIIFGERSKRSENILFKVFYVFYRLFFKLLTGKKMKFGNFSCIPIGLVKKIVKNNDFWNHYSASVIKSKIPFDVVNTVRSKRYYGTSKMNFSSLVIHGLSSLSLYLDVIIVRLLGVISFGIGSVIIGFGVLLYIKYFTERAIPGWTSYLTAIILNIFITLSMFIFLIVLQHLNHRNQKNSQPITFYKDFIDQVLFK